VSADVRSQLHSSHFLNLPKLCLKSKKLKRESSINKILVFKDDIHMSRLNNDINHFDFLGLFTFVSADAHNFLLPIT
jgi:hypothetical protein